jgi:hypothetical protein
MGDIIPSLAIIVTIILFIIQINRQRFLHQMELLTKLEERWDSKEMRSQRIHASTKLLSRKAKISDVECVLNYLASISYLYAKQAIDKELLYHEFSYWIIRNWYCSQPLIIEERKNDIYAWKSYEKMVKLFEIREKRDNVPEINDKTANIFLKKESNLFC